MCGKLASYGRNHGNKNSRTEKLPKHSIDKTHSFISIYYENKNYIHYKLLLQCHSNIDNQRIL